MGGEGSRATRLNRKQRRAQGKRRKGAAPRRGQSPLDAASRLHQAGNLPAAARLYELALMTNPDDARALHMLGVLHGQQGQNGKAADLIQRSVAIDPGQAEWHHNLGAALMNEGRLDAALVAFERALEIDPDNAAAHNKLGNLLADQRKPGQAERALRTALEIDPEMAVAHNNLGAVLWDQGHRDEAAACYRRAIKIDPDFAGAHANLAAVLGDLGRPDERLAAYRRAAELGNAVAAHMLASLTGAATDAPPKEYVAGLFDCYAPRFEKHLRDRLGYDAPTRLARAVRSIAGDGRRFADALDLGCGTGLAGVEFRSQCDRLTGVDLSGGMLREAKFKGIYDHLEKCDLEAFLTAVEDSYDLFIATDVFIYVGNLENLFGLVAARSKARALFAFSTEILEKDGFALMASGRYAHGRAYIDGLAAAHGFVIRACEDGALRVQSGEAVAGNYFVLERGGLPLDRDLGHLE